MMVTATNPVRDSELKTPQHSKSTPVSHMA
jgi:hypothetical protein